MLHTYCKKNVCIIYCQFCLNQLTFSHFIMKRIEVQFSLDTLQLLSLFFLLLIKVMFAHSYSENSQERASENNMLLMYSSVFSCWRRNDRAESCVYVCHRHLITQHQRMSLLMTVKRAMKIHSRSVKRSKLL